MKREKKSWTYIIKAATNFFLSPIISRLSLLIFLNLTHKYFLIDFFFHQKELFFFAYKKFSTENSCDHWNLFLCCLLYKFFIIFCFTIILMCVKRANEYWSCAIEASRRTENEVWRNTETLKLFWNDVESEF